MEKSIKELEEIGYLVCEFDGECNCCDDPEGISFAVGYSNNENGMEVDHYICRKCAEASYDERKKWIES